MSHTAQTTYYGLPIYEDKAGNQPTYLGDWNETMRTIDSSLNAVAAQSSGVVNTANQALSTAQQAQQTANAANTVANAAQQTASGLSDAVETAQQTAEQANTAAGTAQSTAQTANSAAQQASTTASNALSQAQTAASTAGTAQTTANEASTLATTLNQKIRNLSVFTVASKIFPNGATNYFELPGSQVLSALGLSTIPSNATLFAAACNGDVTAQVNMPLRSVAVNQNTWDVNVYVDNPVQGAARVTFFLAVGAQGN